MMDGVYDLSHLIYAGVLVGVAVLVFILPALLSRKD